MYMLSCVCVCVCAYVAMFIDMLPCVLVTVLSFVFCDVMISQFPRTPLFYLICLNNLHTVLMCCFSESSFATCLSICFALCQHGKY